MKTFFPLRALPLVTVLAGLGGLPCKGSAAGGALARSLPDPEAVLVRFAGIAPSAFPAARTATLPLAGALSARAATGVPPIGVSLWGRKMPEAFSVVAWVRIEPSRPAAVLFGIGDGSGDVLVGMTDAFGSPMLEFRNRYDVSQTHRAPTGAARLADARLHVVVAVVNRGTGLVRLYVDGKPEAATTISLWNPGNLEIAFAACSLFGKIDGPGDGEAGLLVPRVIGRELTAAEIAGMRPVADAFGNDMAQIDEGLAHVLARETVVEFWPAEASRRLRFRPGG